MNFLAPFSFLFALTIPVVVVFYLLKRRRVVKLVSSTLLWQKFIAETQASAPFQKLRRNWLLILQILLLLLAVLALTRPYFAAKAPNSDLRVMILDSSASMQSTDEKPSRFEKARQEALAWVDSMRDTDKMVVLQVGANTEVKQSETGDKSALRRAIQACKPTDGPTRPSAAFKMADSLIRDRGKDSNPEIHFFSDGAFPDLTDFENKSLPVIFHRYGTGANNIGITALDVKANPENVNQRAIYASVANYSSNAVNTELELRLDGTLIETRPITMAPAEVSRQIFIATQNNDGVFSLRSTYEDDLAVDNEASIVSLLPHPVKVLLVSKGNKFLERALKSAPSVQLAVSQSLTDDAPEFDFVVLDDVIPAVWPGGNLLAIHVMNTNWFEKISTVEDPAIVDWRATHPLLHYVSFDNVQVSKSYEVKTPSWGVSLVESPSSPLIVAGELGHQRILWIGFDTLESTWPYRISYPIFIANAVEWLNPASERSGQLLVHASDPFRIKAPAGISNAVVTTPDGRKQPIRVEDKDGELVFGETYKQGAYHLSMGTNEIVFCVDLLDSAESNIKPRDELQFGKYVKVESSNVHHANFELWRYIAAAALLVLMFEWWYYHRRTV
jgi:hypothetical protein